jgi:hypothetical protein
MAPPTKPTGEFKSGYEAVFTCTDYHDGPRKGVADFQGLPHFYECIFDDAKDDYLESFWLTPVDQKTFQLAMEDCNTWRRWETAFHSGKSDQTTYPALPSEAARHGELKRILDGILVSNPAKAVTRVGRFEILPDPSLSTGVIRRFQVQWTPEPTPD